MAGLAGGGTISNSAVPEIALRLQDSGYGKPMTWVWGRTRVQPNLAWYADFTAIPHTTESSAGKGGPTMKNTTYTYTVAVMLALGMGPIAGVGRVWAGKSIHTPSSLGLTVFTGADEQQPWGYLQTKYPDAALCYPRIAYVATGAYDLGDSASLPQHTFEVQGPGRFSAAVPDATPLRIVTDMLTDAAAGALFPAGRIGDMKAFDDYTVAMGLFMSPALSEQMAAIDAMAHMAELTGSDWVDSDGRIRLVPLTTVPVAGNGRVYEPDLTPVYRLTDDDFLDPDESGEPVLCQRVFDSDAYNSLALTYCDRDNDYNTNSLTAKDPTNIDLFGERPAQKLDAAWLCTAAAAENAAYLKLGRMLYGRNRYEFSLPPKYLLLECADYVALTDTNLGMVDELVRVVQIDIGADRRMDVIAEEVSVGYGAPVAFGSQAALGYRVDFAAPGSSVNEPVIFNAPVSLTDGAAQVWIAAAGRDSNWSGCDVWISLDGLAYSRIGSITAPARYGVLASAIGPDAPTFDVDMSISGGTLQGGDAGRNVTLSWLGGELISYARATLGSDQGYTLDGVLRARVRTLPCEHPEGTRFVRLDDAVFRYSVPDWFLGSVVYLKFTSRNAVGGATQGLEEVDAYLHTLNTAQTLPGGVLALQLLDGVGGDHFRVGWSAAPGIGYRIQLANARRDVRELTTTLNEWRYTTADAAADGGPARSYLVTVTPINDIGAGEASTLPVSIPAPPAPGGLSVNADVTMLHWNAAPSDAPGGYLAWLGTTPDFDPRDGGGQQVYDGTASAASLPALTTGAMYYARVAAYDQWSKTVADLNISAPLQFIA